MESKNGVSEQQFTGLILVSGVDSPGITEALFEALSPFAVTILDIQQVVIRGRLILTVLISLSPAHAKSIEEDLEECATKLGVDIATAFESSDQKTIAPKKSLLHVVVLSQSLKPAAINAIAAVISEDGGNIERINRTASYPVTAIELTVSGADLATLRSALATTGSELGVDIAVSPGGLMRFATKLVVMDVDSTLIQQEVIELLGAKAGVQSEIAKITESAMRGELDFEASLRARVALLKGLPSSVLVDVQSEITLTPGARTLVRTLKKLGHHIALVSGGFEPVIAPLANELGIDHMRANNLEIADGKLTGELVGPVIDRAGKATALRDFAAEHNVDLDQTIAIGDGANDLDMIAIAGMGIAFNAKPAVKAAADSSVSAPYLDSVLYLMGISREEVEEA
ncbi:phosphoserine phosphatase SerB [Candidatus Planktophila lacus]|uniref:phosphoserine phosphatase n=1 Tax=Candidatus Planktophila lacus TaxID=1884913 RepID=A0AAC9YQP2_9ACTN|nr:phosphoserine phosphatase SerB [Candidatus Planktophila lacus]ASY10630.1 phosphoserine phosphatase [Candidatus Planktophila lacus]